MVYLGINFKKSPSPHVCDHSDRSTRRATFPFGSANYICFKDHLKHKQWGLTMRRKFFQSPQGPPSRFQKLSFWSLSEGPLEKVLYLGINFKKSPSQHIYVHSDPSTRRTHFPFAFANYKYLKEHLQHKQWGLEMRRNFFEGPRAPPRRFQKLSFWPLSKEK